MSANRGRSISTSVQAHFDVYNAKLPGSKFLRSGKMPTTITFRDIGKKLNAYMAKICECRKYAIFHLYLTIYPAEPVYKSFYGAVNIV